MKKSIGYLFMVLFASSFSVGCKKKVEIKVVDLDLASFDNMKIHIFNSIVRQKYELHRKFETNV